MSQFGFVCCFLMLKFRLCGFFGQEYHRTKVVSFPVPHIGKDMMWIFCITGAVNFDHWLMWCLPGFSFVKLLFFFSCLISIIWGDTLRLREYFSLYFYSVILASIDDSSLQRLLLWCLPNGDFSVLIILSTFIVRILL